MRPMLPSRGRWPSAYYLGRVYPLTSSLAHIRSAKLFPKRHCPSDLPPPMRNYHIYDLSVNSDLDLPADPSIKATTDPARTLSVLYLPEALQEFTRVQWISSRYGGLIRSYDTQEGILVCVEGEKHHLRFWASSDGSTLKFDSSCSIAPAVIANLGLSICKLLQGDVTLHGVAVEVGRKLVGVLARSQTGKSTLLWTLLDAGAQFAGDDVLPVHIQDAKVVATPSVSLHAKFSQETLVQRDIDHTQLQPISRDADVFWLPFARESRAVDERQLDALFVLQPTPFMDVDTVHVSRLGGGEAISLLMENTHGLWAAYPVLDGRRLFDIYAALVKNMPIYVLAYVRRYEVLPRLVDTILSCCAKG